MKLPISTLIFFLSAIYSFAQTQIEGHCICSNNSTIPKFAHIFIPSSKEAYTSKITDGAFTLICTTPSTDKVILGYIYFTKKQMLSTIDKVNLCRHTFIVEKGKITLIYNSSKKYLAVKGGMLNEHYEQDKQIDSIRLEEYKKIQISSDLFAANYKSARMTLSLIKEHPTSPVFTPWLWSVVQFYPKTDESYTEIKEIFDRMQDSYKKSDAGLLVTRELNKLKDEIELVKSKENMTVESFDLKNINGLMVPLHSFNKNKILILDFWTTYCTPCKKDKPSLAELEKKYEQKGVLVLRVAADKKFEVWSKYAKNNKIDQNSYWIDLSKYNSNNLLKSIHKFPTYILIDASNMQIVKWDIGIDKIEDVLMKLQSNK